ncbi:MAG: FAD-dependent oxidoreductase [Candidatus Dormibacteraeota bacterium]|nr:FAD-dependent oxidoreductase [Candidatus Dormibacteraeota bacterium]
MGHADGVGRSSSGDHVVVIGAGAAGLTAAHELVEQGRPVTVVEKDWVVGGISRTMEFMGCRFDVGPQRLRGGDAEVERLVADVLPADLLSLRVMERMLCAGKFFAGALTWSDLVRQLGPVEAGRCLASYAQARMQAVAEPRCFEEAVTNQVGRRLFAKLFKEYTEKVWGRSTRDLGADGIGQLGLPWVADRAPVGDDGLLADSFLYPRLGTGQVWLAVADRLEAAGHPVRLGEEVVAVRHARGRVIAVALRDGAGRTVDLVGSDFISTMPVAALMAKLSPAPPRVVRAAADALRYRDVVTVNVVLDRAEVFSDQVISIHDAGVGVARISNFKNLSPGMVADPGLTGLGMEYFCFEGDALWAMADAELLDRGRRDLIALGLCRPDDVKAGMVYRQRRIHSLGWAAGDDLVELGVEARSQAVGAVAEWANGALPNLWLAGRHGIECGGAEDHGDPEELGEAEGQGQAVRSGLRAARGVALRASVAGRRAPAELVAS